MSEAPARLTVDTVVDEWLETKRFKSLKTREQYEWAVSHVKRELAVSYDVRERGEMPAVRFVFIHVRAADVRASRRSQTRLSS